MNHSLVSALVAASAVGDLREELMKVLGPTVENLVDTAVQFVLSPASPAATLAFGGRKRVRTICLCPVCHK